MVRTAFAAGTIELVWTDVDDAGDVAVICMFQNHHAVGLGMSSG